MNFRAIDLNAVEEVADVLKDLLHEIVFVGGSVISMYIDDPAADEVRTTNDIDFTVQLTGYSNWIKLQETLQKLRIYPYPEGHAMCNFIYKGILIDIIPSEDSPVGKANRWYKPGFSYLKSVKVGKHNIQIFQLPYFLATKFEAFNDRGKDYRTSHDFEDIIYVLDNCTTAAEDVINADLQVKSYLKKELIKIKDSMYFEEIVSAHIHPNMLNERLSLVIEKINKILS